MRAHGYDAQDEGLCAHLFDAARTCDHTFTDEEVHALCQAYTASRGVAIGAA